MIDTYACPSLAPTRRPSGQLCPISLAPVVKGGGIEVSAIRPYQCVNFGVQPHLIEKIPSILFPKWRHFVKWLASLSMVPVFQQLYLIKLDPCFYQALLPARQ